MHAFAVHSNDDFLEENSANKNVTEKEKIPSAPRVPCYMYCHETFSYSVQNLSYLNSLSIGGSLRERAPG